MFPLTPRPFFAAQTWAGKEENWDAAQQILVKLAKANSGAPLRRSTYERRSAFPSSSLRRCVLADAGAMAQAIAAIHGG